MTKLQTSKLQRILWVIEFYAVFREKKWRDITFVTFVLGSDFRIHQIEKKRKKFILYDVDLGSLNLSSLTCDELDVASHDSDGFDGVVRNTWRTHRQERTAAQQYTSATKKSARRLPRPGREAAQVKISAIELTPLLPKVRTGHV